MFAILGACARAKDTTPGTVEVTLDWANRSASATPSPSPAPAEWTTNRGYRVRLDEGYLHSHTVELVRCKAASAFFDGLFGVREAWAGHSSDPSTEPLRLRSPHVESLLGLAASRMGTLRPPSGEYCAAFFLVARALPEYPPGDEPASVDFPGRKLSVFARGAWLRPPATEWTAFSAETGSAYGQNATSAGVSGAIPERATITVPAGGTIGLRVVRDTQRLLDDIDLASASPEKIGRQMISHLVDSTRVLVEAR